MFDEFEAPKASHGASREITPVFIMELFPRVRVSRNVQGNAYAVSLWNAISKRWSVAEIVNTPEAALSFAAKHG